MSSYLLSRGGDALLWNLLKVKNDWNLEMLKIGTSFYEESFCVSLSIVFCPVGNFCVDVTTHTYVQNPFRTYTDINVFHFFPCKVIENKPPRGERYVWDGIVMSNRGRESGESLLLFCNNCCVGGFKGFINKLYFSFTFNKMTSRCHKKRA